MPKKTALNKKILKAIQKVFNKSNEFINHGTYQSAKVCFQDLADEVEKEIIKE